MCVPSKLLAMCLVVGLPEAAAAQPGPGPSQPVEYRGYLTVGASRAHLDFNPDFTGAGWQGGVRALDVGAGLFLKPGLALDVEFTRSSAAQPKTSSCGRGLGWAPSLGTDPTKLGINYPDDLRGGVCELHPQSGFAVLASVIAYHDLTPRFRLGFRVGGGGQAAARRSHDRAGVRSRVRRPCFEHVSLSRGPSIRDGRSTHT